MNRPIALMCYICGRQFGTKSLGIHIKTCEKKWQAEESQKPPKQRRPCPRAPPGLQEMLGKSNITKQDIMAFNNGSFDTFKQQALVGCEYCGRKFNPKSLIPHQKACAKDPMIRKPYVAKNQNYQEKVEQPPIASKGYNFNVQDQGNNNLQLTECRKCSRKFNIDRIGKHQKVCKGPQIKHVKGISEKYEVKTATKPNMKKIDTKPPKWKAQHQQLVSAMRQMRKIKAFQEKGGDISKLPPPPRSDYSHYVECKYCGRNYAPEVAERHIPKCANIINKPGGIKPSNIQSKYVNGTGSQGMKSTSSGLKPGISSITKTTVTSSAIKPPIIASTVKSATKPVMASKIFVKR